MSGVFAEMPWINITVNGRPLRYNNETNQVEHVHVPAAETVGFGRRPYNVRVRTGAQYHGEPLAQATTRWRMNSTPH